MVKTALSDSDFQKLVSQAKLVLSKEEEAKIKSQIDEAISAVQVLGELDTKGVPTLNHPTGSLQNVWREDVVTPSLTQELALREAPRTHKCYFVVKAIFDETA